MEIDNKRPSYRDLKKKALENPEIKKEYDNLAPVYEKIRQKIKQRIAEGETGILSKEHILLADITINNLYKRSRPSSGTLPLIFLKKKKPNSM